MLMRFDAGKVCRTEPKGSSFLDALEGEESAFKTCPTGDGRSTLVRQNAGYDIWRNDDGQYDNLSVF